MTASPQPRPTTWTWGESENPLARLDRRMVNGRLVYALSLLPELRERPGPLALTQGTLTLPSRTHSEALERAGDCVAALQTYLDTVDTAERRLLAALAAARDGQTDLLEGTPHD